MTFEGWVPAVGERVTLAEVIERAFDYRGNVTIVKTDGGEIVGYVFNRNADLPEPFIQLFDQAGWGPLKILYSEIATIQFTGKDVAEGKSWAAWVERREREKAEQGGRPRPADRGGRLLILTGVEIEARALARALRLAPELGAGGDPAWSGPEGNGSRLILTVGARDGLSQTVLLDRPRLLLGVGLAGGLAPDLEPGCLVVGAEVTDPQGTVWHSDRELLDRATRCLVHLGVPHRVGRLVTQDRIVSTPGDKAALWRESGALAVDMESAHLLAEAHRLEIPVLAVRAIVDGPQMTLDQAWMEVFTPRGGLDSVRLTRLFLRRPDLLPQALRLTWASRRALFTLGRFLPAFVGEASRMIS